MVEVMVNALNKAWLTNCAIFSLMSLINSVNKFKNRPFNESAQYDAEQKIQYRKFHCLTSLVGPICFTLKLHPEKYIICVLLQWPQRVYRHEGGPAKPPEAVSCKFLQEVVNTELNAPISGHRTSALLYKHPVTLQYWLDRCSAGTLEMISSNILLCARVIFSAFPVESFILL